MVREKLKRRTESRHSFIMGNTTDTAVFNVGDCFGNFELLNLIRNTVVSMVWSERLKPSQRTTKQSVSQQVSIVAAIDHPTDHHVSVVVTLKKHQQSPFLTVLLKMWFISLIFDVTHFHRRETSRWVLRGVRETESPSSTNARGAILSRQVRIDEAYDLFEQYSLRFW